MLLNLQKSNPGLKCKLTHNFPTCCKNVLCDLLSPLEVSVTLIRALALVGRIWGFARMGAIEGRRVGSGLGTVLAVGESFFLGGTWAWNEQGFEFSALQWEGAGRLGWLGWLPAATRPMFKRQDVWNPPGLSSYFCISSFFPFSSCSSFIFSTSSFTPSFTFALASCGSCACISARSSGLISTVSSQAFAAVSSCCSGSWCSRPRCSWKWIWAAQGIQSPEPRRRASKRKKTSQKSQLPFLLHVFLFHLGLHVWFFAIVHCQWSKSCWIDGLKTFWSLQWIFTISYKLMHLGIWVAHHGHSQLISEI